MLLTYLMLSKDGGGGIHQRKAVENLAVHKWGVSSERGSGMN